MATYEQVMAKARELAAAGRMEEARRAGQIAVKLRDAEKSEKKSFGQTVWENVVGDNDPNSHNFGERVGAALNKAGEALTSGLVGDEADAAVRTGGGLWGDYDKALDANRQSERVLERDNPGLALGAELGGAVLGSVLPGGALARGLPKLARAPAWLLPRTGIATSLPARVGASVATGSGMGATYGLMEGEGADRAGGAKTGAMFGAAGGVAAPIIGGVVQKGANALAGSRAIKRIASGAPTSDELLATGRQLYDDIDKAGVQIKPDAFSAARQKIMQHLQSQGLDQLPGPGSLTPKSARVAQIAKEMDDTLQATPTAALPFSSLDQLRRHAGTAAADVSNRTDARLGAETISQLDDFVQNLGVKDVTSGDIKALQTLIPKARDVWARMSRSRLVDDAIENSEHYLSGGASGIRNQFKRIVSSPKLSRGFSEAELKVMKRVAKGTLPEQLLYLVSGGLGNMGTIGVGMMTLGGPLGAMAGTGAALGFRKGAEKIANRNAELARALVANGGLKALPTASPANKKITEALTRRIGAATPQMLQ